MARQVIVCGAGAAGMAAAIAAARSGADVFLVEASSGHGGTVANVLIHTIGGLFDSAGQLLNSGLACELVERLTAADADVRPRRLGRTWVLNACPDVYREVTRLWLAEHSAIKILYNARVQRVGTRTSRIESVEVTGDAVEIRSDALIDCTGSAEVVRLIDSALVQDDMGRAAGGLIVRLDGVQAESLAFPRGLALLRGLRGAAARGELPGELEHAWLDSGVRPGEAYLKLMVPLGADWRDPEVRAEIAQSASTHAAAAVEFLRRSPELQKIKVSRIGELGVRDGGRVCGEYSLTSDDVHQARKFTDAACRCCWPIEFWDVQRGVSLHYLPDNEFYDIPLRALKVRGFDNLWVAGKCLSADRQAQASARIAGTCWAMGDAVGRAVAS